MKIVCALYVHCMCMWVYDTHKSTSVKQVKVCLLFIIDKQISSFPLEGEACFEEAL